MSCITEPSICIPRTLNKLTWYEVKTVFEGLFGRGTVERVDIVRDRHDEQSPFCKIFVHMRYWPLNNLEVAEIRDKLIAGEQIKVVYDQPWFWKCSASRTAKPQRNLPKTTPYVEFANVQSTPLSSPVLERSSSDREMVEEEVARVEKRLNLQVDVPDADAEAGVDVTLVSEREGRLSPQTREGSE